MPDEPATLELGANLAAALGPGLVVYLEGQLGAGKTTLVRGLLRKLNYQGKVKSPTYTLVELYVISSLYLYHFDLYRLTDPDEWADAGFREYFGEHAVCLVEWPEKAAGVLPAADLQIQLSVADLGRTATLQALTEAGAQCLTRLPLAPPSPS